jgi:hypothetical protein
MKRMILPVRIPTLLQREVVEITSTAKLNPLHSDPLGLLILIISPSAG